MEFMMNILIVCFLCFMSLVATKSPVVYDTIYMDEHCGSHFVIGDDEFSAVQIKMTRKQYYSIKGTCNVTLSAHTQRQRLQFKMMQMDINHEMFRECGYLDELSILSIYGNEERLVGTFCGDTVSSSFPTEVDMSTMKLVFTSSSTSSSTTKPRHTGFTGYVNEFHEGYCMANEEVSCTNHKCISENLTCDGWDNCGDNSDEEREELHCKNAALTHGQVVGPLGLEVTHVIVLIVLAVTITVAIVTTIVCLVVQGRNKNVVGVTSPRHWSWSTAAAPELESGRFGY